MDASERTASQMKRYSPEWSDGYAAGLAFHDARMEAVRQAVSSGERGADIVRVARSIADFLSGTNDAEVIGAVRELAKKVG